jgi:predicted deacylase
MRNLTLGGQRVDPGTRVQGMLSVGSRLDGTPLGIPFMAVRGYSDGPTLCIDAGVHGSEYEPMIGIHTLLKEVRPEDLSGTLITTPVLNVQAFEMMRRVNPVDYLDHDMNRSYPGSKDGFITHRQTFAHVDQVISKADYGISFHSGGAGLQWWPFINLGEAPGSLELGKAMGPGWEVIGEWGGFKGKVVTAYEQRGLPCFSGEIGGPATHLLQEFRANWMLVTNGLLNVMRHLKMLPGQPVNPSHWWVVKQHALRPDKAGLTAWEPIATPRKMVKKGDLLARMVDFFGREIEAITAPVDGVLSSVRPQATAYPGHSLGHVGEIREVLHR